MTLHRLRVTVGDEDFFKILRQWAQSRSGDSVRTSEFVALAERISGRSLDALFRRWLFTTEKPFLAGTAASRLSSPTALRAVPKLARGLVDRSKRDRWVGRSG